MRPIRSSFFSDIVGGDCFSVGYCNFGVGEGGTSAIFAGFTLFCQGICALIVAIPLMVSNNGFDDSKLTDIFG